jgi:hypothetical protein
MQSAFLMLVYILTAAVVQFAGFLVSRLVEYAWPSFGLMAFLIIFMAAFGIAWPIALRIAEWGIRKAGYEVDGVEAKRA